MVQTSLHVSRRCCISCTDAAV